MAIRFKFRSSMNFDSLDIDGQTSISIRDLKTKIIHHKNLICKDFDLVFSDAITGQEFGNEKFEIPSGSSVIIRRVPAGTNPTEKLAVDTVGMFGLRDISLVKTIMPNVTGNNFDDFGVDLCPEPDMISYDSNEIDKVNDINIENTNTEKPRLKHSEPFISKCQRLESSYLSEAVPERKESVPKITTKVEECMKFEQVGNKKLSAIQSADLPSELKCSLCKDFYKEAVMIPCCQHSFCKKCICLVLDKKQRCPKCSSPKFRVEDLLPNLSLRQAIEHFLGSQISACDPESDFDRYVPDGESGIHPKDVSCAITVHQSEPELPNSPSATGRGSNQINIESAYKSVPHNDPSIGDSNYSTHFGAVNLDTNWKKGPWSYASGGNKFFAPNDSDRKGGRSCYTCGSQDHLMRDCPAASRRFQNGVAPNYFPTCWNGPMLPQVGPFQHMYGNPGMFTFNSAMVPTPPYTVPTYMSPMYGGVPFQSGLTRMGIPSPPMRTSEYTLNHLDPSELQDWKRRHNSLKGQFHSTDSGDSFNKRYDAKRSNHHRPHTERENATNDPHEEKHKKAASKHKDQISVEKPKLERSKTHIKRHHISHSGSDSDHRSHRRATNHDRWRKASGSDEGRYGQKGKRSR